MRSGRAGRLLMKSVVTMRFGSHLYGTSTPASDVDLKSVHLPSATDILLGRAKAVISTSTKLDPTQKNTSADIDTESFTLQQFLKLASQGQTVAVDMLFAPEWAWQHNAGLWWRIVANRHRLLTRQSASFVGYCRSQANKYGIRGSRVAAARAARDLLAGVLTSAGSRPLGDFAHLVRPMAEATEHMAVIGIPSQAGAEVLHWEVCNKKMPFTASVKSAYEIMDRVVNEYGHRALAAEKNEGVDWKALSHAVRIANQALELLATGHVTFPRPEAEHLLAIKTGKLVYAAVAEEIDELLAAVEEAETSSTLPAHVDQEWIDALVVDTYRAVVIRDGRIVPR